MRNKLLVAGTLALAMTCTTVFSSITPAVVKAASVSTVQTQTAENSDDYIYCYAGLTWAEYWKAEGVTAAGDTTSSDTADSHDEYDKGAFDAVTRATSNHGLHRGNFQCTAIVYDEDGTSYSLSYWKDKSTVVLTNGSEVGLSRGVITLSDGSDWRVAVENPADTGSYIGVLSIKDKAVITSGGYERYFKQDGKTYHHIIDPANGYPANNGLTSVTIVSDDGTLADGLSTSLFIMGPEKAQKYWKEHSDEFDTILVKDDGSILVSEGIADCFTSESDFTIIKK